MDLDSVAGELYGLPPEDFTAARTARAKEAKAAGDKALATRISALAKPNQVAWLANQLAREHQDELRALVDLGAGLREAADALTGDQLRDFTRQKRQLVGALVQQGRGLATRAGRKVSLDAARGLEETLNAALADPAAAGLVLEGRLSSGLQNTGFGPAVGGGKPALSSVPGPSGPPAAASRSGSKEQRLAARLATAEHEVEQARQSAERAAATRAEAETAVERAAVECRKAEDKVARLQAKLEHATTAQAEADWERRRTKKDLEKADRLVAQTVRRLREAEECRRALDPEADS
jgi:hypothetical protein